MATWPSRPDRCRAGSSGSSSPPRQPIPTGTRRSSPGAPPSPPISTRSPATASAVSWTRGIAANSCSRERSGRSVLPEPAASAIAAKAVALNVTVVNPAGPGHLTFFSSGPVPVVSTLNYGGLRTRANNAIVRLRPLRQSPRQLRGRRDPPPHRRDRLLRVTQRIEPKSLSWLSTWLRASAGNPSAQFFCASS